MISKSFLISSSLSCKSLVFRYNDLIQPDPSIKSTLHIEASFSFLIGSIRYFDPHNSVFIYGQGHALNILFVKMLLLRIGYLHS